MGLIDLTGQKFGRLTVLYRDTEAEKLRKDRHAMWKCQCECGNQTTVVGKDLRAGKTQSCGCLQKERTKQVKGSNLLGKRFGKLLVVEQLPSKNYRTYWKCKCDCGKEIEVCARELSAGDTTSCGCSKIKNELGNRYGKLVVIEQVENLKKGAYWKCQCDCGNTCIVSGAELRNGHIKSCGCLNSKGELLLTSLLVENGFDFQTEYKFIDCLTENNQPCRFDFAIFKNNQLLCLIEYDGIQHFQNTNFGGLEQNQKRDSIKNQYCQDNKIPLIRIPYTDYDKIDMNYLKERIDEECTMVSLLK